MYAVPYHLSRCQSGMFSDIRAAKGYGEGNQDEKEITRFAAESRMRRCFVAGWIRQSAFKAPVWNLRTEIFLFYINGKRISDQELMPAMTNYALQSLGCETTYPVWG